MGMEFTNNNSKRVLLPLEPDFSNMSDPRVVIEPPDNNWRSDNRQTLQTSLSGRISRRDQSRSKHKSKKRRRCRYPLHPLLGLHLQTLPKEVASQKDPNIFTRKGEEDKHLLLLLHYLIISPMIMADTKEVDIVQRLHRI